MNKRTKKVPKYPRMRKDLKIITLRKQLIRAKIEKRLLEQTIEKKGRKSQFFWRLLAVILLICAWVAIGEIFQWPKFIVGIVATEMILLLPLSLMSLFAAQWAAEELDRKMVALKVGIKNRIRRFEEMRLGQNHCPQS